MAINFYWLPHVFVNKETYFHDKILITQVTTICFSGNKYIITLQEIINYFTAAYFMCDHWHCSLPSGEGLRLKNLVLQSNVLQQQ